MRVTVLEKKANSGEKLHTTGIIVKDAIDQVALLDGLPSELVRRIAASGCTLRTWRMSICQRPVITFWRRILQGDALAGCAGRTGRARVAYQTSFSQAARSRSGFDLGAAGTTRYLVGADGPNSRVAKAFGLGQNSQFLFGVEHEYAGAEIEEPDKLHCRRSPTGAWLHRLDRGRSRRRTGGPRQASRQPSVHGEDRNGRVPEKDRSDVQLP
jgi:flavin-dependent dehydrogenase